MNISFVNFKGLYKNFPGEYHSIKVRINRERPSIIDENWNLLTEAKKKKMNFLKSLYNKFLKSIYFFTSFVKISILKVKSLIIPNTIIYGERGKKYAQFWQKSKGLMQKI